MVENPRAETTIVDKDGYAGGVVVHEVPVQPEKGTSSSNSEHAAVIPPEQSSPDVPANTLALVQPPLALSPPQQLVAAAAKPRVDWNKARASIRPNHTFPDVLNDYQFDWNEPTSVYPDWHESTEELYNIAWALIQALQFAHTHPVGEKAGYVRAIVENFIWRFKTKLDTRVRPLDGLPWGQTWHPFSITIPCMLAHYLLLGSGSLEQESIALINDLIVTPKQSLGWTRDTANSLYMAGPWLLAQYLSGHLDQALTHEDYTYAMDHGKMEVRCLRKDTGVHRDCSFYCRDLRVSFAYLADLCSDLTRFYYALDTRITQTPELRWAAMRKILFHPTVAYGNVGLVGCHQPTLQCQTEPSSEYGIAVMPFCRYMRYFTRTRQFSVRAQVDHLAFYEADKSVDYMAQYWVQYRRAHAENSDAKVAFPGSGFICRASQDTLTRIPSTTSTSPQIFMPKYAKSMVMAYKMLGVLYQEYEIAEFGDFVVSELIVVNAETATVNIRTRVKNSECEALAYYGAEREKMTIPAKGTAVFKMLIGMDDGSTSVGHLSVASFPKFPLKLSDTLSVQELSDIKSYVLFENGLPVISTPYEWDNEPTSLTQVIDGRSYVFEFCTKANQYVQMENMRQNSLKSEHQHQHQQ